MFSRKIALSYALQADPYWKQLKSLTADLPPKEYLLVCDLTTLEIMNSELAFHNDNFC